MYKQEQDNRNRFYCDECGYLIHAGQKIKDKTIFLKDSYAI